MPRFPFMKKNTLLVSFLLLNVSLGYPIENQPSGARSLALSHASVSLADIWSNTNNQAGLAYLQHTTAAFYFESRFMVETLETISGSLALPVNAGTFGINFYQFGKGTYKETKTGIAFAKKLSENWSAGIQLDYFALKMPENKGALNLMTFEGGIIYSANENLFLGAHFFNPVLQRFKTQTGKIELPAVLRLGGHYLFNRQVLLAFEIEKNTTNTLSLKTGFEYLLVKNLALRFGISGKPLNFTSGLGYTYKKITTDFAFSYHDNLGITPSVSVQFEL